MKKQLEIINQLFELGLISHVEKLRQSMIIKSVHASQKRDSE